MKSDNKLLLSFIILWIILLIFFNLLYYIPYLCGYSVAGTLLFYLAFLSLYMVICIKFITFRIFTLNKKNSYNSLMSMLLVYLLFNILSPIMLFDDSHHFFLISIPQNTSLSIPQIDPYRYLLATLLIAPILEEITYRGFLQQYLINGKKPFWIIILVPALVFTISHIEKMTSWHIIFFVGILYGFIYYRFKNLTINILCHFLWNFLGITFVNQMTFNLYSIIIYCLSVILFTFIVIRIVRQIKRNISIEYENTEEMET